MCPFGGTTVTVRLDLECQVIADRAKTLLVQPAPGGHDALPRINRAHVVTTLWLLDALSK